MRLPEGQESEEGGEGGRNDDRRTRAKPKFRNGGQYHGNFGQLRNTMKSGMGFLY
jgi:hypothetical protein